jgi:predicted nucleotidyltransferase
MIANTRLRNIITESVNKISSEYKPKKIILFGSYAYGNPSEDSDIDLLIIKNTDKRPIDRWLEVKKFLRGISQTVSISPLVYTEKEIADRLAIKDFFVKDILEKGEVLYG